MNNILVIYGSSRRNGNSEWLTEQVIQDLDVTRVYLADKKLNAVIDQRHTPEGFQLVDDDYEEILPLLLNHEIIIFATPLYWYGMSGALKNFIDRWSQYLRDQRFSFKEVMSQKKVYLVVVGGDQPAIEALPLIQQFTFICRFMKMEFIDYIIGRGNKPGEITADKAALSKAALLNHRLKLHVTLPSTAGQGVQLWKKAQEKHLVLFFYPGDGAGLRYPELAGCTAEACSFRDNIGELANLGAAVYGVSLQPTERQQDFVEREHLNFELLSDANHELVSNLSIPLWTTPTGEEYVTRTTVIIERGGVIHKVMRDVQVEGHIAEVLAVIKSLS